MDIPWGPGLSKMWAPALETGRFPQCLPDSEPGCQLSSSISFAQPDLSHGIPLVQRAFLCPSCLSTDALWETVGLPPLFLVLLSIFPQRCSSKPVSQAAVSMWTCGTGSGSTTMSSPILSSAARPPERAQVLRHRLPDAMVHGFAES